MLQNAYSFAKIGADTAENERKIAENLPKIGNYPTGPSSPRWIGRPAGGRGGGRGLRARRRGRLPEAEPRAARAGDAAEGGLFGRVCERPYQSYFIQIRILTKFCRNSAECFENSPKFRNLWKP